MNKEVQNKIEAVLFVKGEGATAKDLAGIVGASTGEVLEALEDLRTALKERGLRLMEANGIYTLGTAPEASGEVEKVLKEDLQKDIGKAGIETLSLVLYLGPIARSRIDYIRGVNSTFILRNLTMRGLVERISNPSDQRGFLYRPTIDLLAHLGIEQVEDLPDYEQVRADIEAFEQGQDKEDNKSNTESS